MSFYPDSFRPEIVEWESPREAPIQHSHVDTNARLPEVCPACAKLWADVFEWAREVNIEEEHVVARKLRYDRGDDMAWDYLTNIRERALIAKARSTGLGRR